MGECVQVPIHSKLLETDTAFVFYCKGCKTYHALDKDCWQFNGSYDSPTFHPSLLVNGDSPELGIRCHLFIVAGNIKYLEDCEHELKNRIIPMCIEREEPV